MKVNGLMAHTYSHLYGLRFFTYIEDIVEVVLRCCDKTETPNDEFDPLNANPSTVVVPHCILILALVNQ